MTKTSNLAWHYTCLYPGQRAYSPDAHPPSKGRSLRPRVDSISHSQRCRPPVGIGCLCRHGRKRMPSSRFHKSARSWAYQQLKILKSRWFRYRSCAARPWRECLPTIRLHAAQKFHQQASPQGYKEENHQPRVFILFENSRVFDQVSQIKFFGK